MTLLAIQAMKQVSPAHKSYYGFSSIYPHIGVDNFTADPVSLLDDFVSFSLPLLDDSCTTATTVTHSSSPERLCISSSEQHTSLRNQAEDRVSDMEQSNIQEGSNHSSRQSNDQGREQDSNETREDSNQSNIQEGSNHSSRQSNDQGREQDSNETREDSNHRVSDAEQYSRRQ